MKASTKARLKIAGGYASLFNACASSVGLGALSFLTRRHHITPMSTAACVHGIRNARERIKQGEAELAEALRYER